MIVRQLADLIECLIHFYSARIHVVLRPSADTPI